MTDRTAASDHDPTEPVTEPVTETWVFGGLRVGGGGRRIWCWIDPMVEDPHDRELWFKAGRGAAPSVGSEYQVLVTRHGDRTSLHAQPPRYLRQHSDAALRAELEARHRAADTRLRLAAMEASDKRSSALDAAMAPLLAVAATLPPTDRDASPCSSCASFAGRAHDA
ncbi:hypothetical protein BJF78_34685 [Pseudonocardia sp. CNS-139]|nr:hypothetical protein BJF78_34685 [Pseudonocardia sp. CNS-139]